MGWTAISGLAGPRRRLELLATAEDPRQHSPRILVCRRSTATGVREYPVLSNYWRARDWSQLLADADRVSFLGSERACSVLGMGTVARLQRRLAYCGVSVAQLPDFLMFGSRVCFVRIPDLDVFRRGETVNVGKLIKSLSAI